MTNMTNMANNPENENIERKQSLGEMRAIVETVSAFATMQAVADLNALVTRGLLIRVGRSRATHYIPVIPPEFVHPEVRRAFQVELFDDTENPST